MTAQYETVFYRGYEIEVCSKDFLVFAPNKDVACFPSMSRVRLWIRQHRGDRTRKQGQKGGGGKNHNQLIAG